jgi:hypothetical protein
MASGNVNSKWTQNRGQVEEEEEDDDPSEYHIKYTGLGNMLKRVVENRSSLEKEIPAEKATKVPVQYTKVPVQSTK